jgi:hypothetical protein
MQQQSQQPRRPAYADSCFAEKVAQLSALPLLSPSLLVLHVIGSLYYMWLAANKQHSAWHQAL